MQQPESEHVKNWLVPGLLAVLGISFWFLLGFPFANHNESYIWIARFDGMGFLDALTTTANPPSNPRPLGMLTALLAYRISGENSDVVQFVNYLGAIAAWLLLCCVVPRRGAFSLIALLVGGVYFSGYIYLFHLHGVFYSPALIFLALLIVEQERRRTPGSGRLLSALFVLSAAALFHPFTIPLFVVGVLGMILERRLPQSTGSKLLLIAALGYSVALYAILVSSPGTGLAARGLQGLIATYRMTEVRPAVAMLSTALAALVVLESGGNMLRRVLLLIATIGLSVLAVVAGIPAITVWVLICGIAMVTARRWTLALLVPVTFLFPMVTGTGSPTYSVFVLVVCAYITASCLPRTDGVMGFLNRPVLLGSWMVALGLILAIRAGVEVPVVRAVARPLLAERDKTYQLEESLTWIRKRELGARRVLLAGSAENPVDAANALDRRNRPPTSQASLDVYTRMLGFPAAAAADTLFVCFGGQTLEKRQLIHEIPSRFGGTAHIYSTGDSGAR